MSPLLAQSRHKQVHCTCPLSGVKRTSRRAFRSATQKIFTHRLTCQSAKAMAAATQAVTNGSAHCGGKCDGCAKTSPINVAKALIVICRMSDLLRSICTRRTTLTTAPTIPQIEASCACSRLNARAKSPRAITRKQASHAPANFSMATRSSPLERRSSTAGIASFKLGMS
jgi:hypothetical protein